MIVSQLSERRLIRRLVTSGRVGLSPKQFSAIERVERRIGINAAVNQVSARCYSPSRAQIEAARGSERPGAVRFSSDGDGYCV